MSKSEFSKFLGHLGDLRSNVSQGKESFEAQYKVSGSTFYKKVNDEIEELSRFLDAAKKYAARDSSDFSKIFDKKGLTEDEVNDLVNDIIKIRGDINEKLGESIESFGSLDILSSTAAKEVSRMKSVTRNLMEEVIQTAFLNPDLVTMTDLTKFLVETKQAEANIKNLEDSIEADKKDYDNVPGWDKYKEIAIQLDIAEKFVAALREGNKSAADFSWHAKRVVEDLSRGSEGLSEDSTSLIKSFKGFTGQVGSFSKSAKSGDLYNVVKSGSDVLAKMIIYGQRKAVAAALKGGKLGGWYGRAKVRISKGAPETKGWDNVVNIYIKTGLLVTKLGNEVFTKLPGFLKLLTVAAWAIQKIISMQEWSNKLNKEILLAVGAYNIPIDINVPDKKKFWRETFNKVRSYLIDLENIETNLSAENYIEMLSSLAKGGMKLDPSYFKLNKKYDVPEYKEPLTKLANLAALFGFDRKELAQHVGNWVSGFGQSFDSINDDLVTIYNMSELADVNPSDFLKAVTNISNRLNLFNNKSTQVGHLLLKAVRTGVFGWEQANKLMGDLIERKTDKDPLELLRDSLLASNGDNQALVDSIVSSVHAKIKEVESSIGHYRKSHDTEKIIMAETEISNLKHFLKIFGNVDVNNMDEIASMLYTAQKFVISPLIERDKKQLLDLVKEKFGKIPNNRAELVARLGDVVKMYGKDPAYIKLIVAEKFSESKDNVDGSKNADSLADLLKKDQKGLESLTVKFSEIHDFMGARILSGTKDFTEVLKIGLEYFVNTLVGWIAKDSALAVGVDAIVDWLEKLAKLGFSGGSSNVGVVTGPVSVTPDSIVHIGDYVFPFSNEVRDIKNIGGPEDHKKRGGHGPGSFWGNPGQDIGAPTGSPVLAIRGGKIIKISSWSPFKPKGGVNPYGASITYVTDPDSAGRQFEIYITHLGPKFPANLKTGGRIEAGQVLAWVDPWIVGGKSIGPTHIHMGIRLHKPGQGTRAGGSILVDPGSFLLHPFLNSRKKGMTPEKLASVTKASGVGKEITKEILGKINSKIYKTIYEKLPGNLKKVFKKYSNFDFYNSIQVKKDLIWKELVTTQGIKDPKIQSKVGGNLNRIIDTLKDYVDKKTGEIKVPTGLRQDQLNLDLGQFNTSSLSSSQEVVRKESIYANVLPRVGYTLVEGPELHYAGEENLDLHYQEWQSANNNPVTEVASVVYNLDVEGQTGSEAVKSLATTLMARYQNMYASSISDVVSDAGYDRGPLLRHLYGNASGDADIVYDSKNGEYRVETSKIDDLSKFRENTNSRDTSLNHLHPDFKSRVDAWLSDCRKEGVMPIIFETWRSPERSKAIKAPGVSKAGAWESGHNYGRAIDIRPPGWTFSVESDRKKMGRLFSITENPAMKKIVDLAHKHKLEWGAHKNYGGDWTTMHDAPHFQMPNEGASFWKRNFPRWQPDTSKKVIHAPKSKPSHISQ